MSPNSFGNVLLEQFSSKPWATNDRNECTYFGKHLTGIVYSK
jgi:hypothetical protein